MAEIYTDPFGGIRRYPLGVAYTQLVYARCFTKVSVCVCVHVKRNADYPLRDI